MERFPDKLVERAPAAASVAAADQGHDGQRPVVDLVAALKCSMHDARYPRRHRTSVTGKVQEDAGGAINNSAASPKTLTVARWVRGALHVR